ncbi:hypothetical protein RFI_27149 [Reticulomyxa filosa]|uniref:Alpha-galactosidase n=1 Tax=Reticulomyxa filosa TaxID=46433 RepID=X6M9A5_RETFI|nr:hypothetical protein RFI_27149 [Reticulomyxa filosa]|eukprot:ETO10231.1 hypothetical protein RFI_27149 [Reticulomyxa filosa]
MSAMLLLYSLVGWLGIAKGLNNGLGLTPQMGWNSWNAFHCNIDQTLIQETIQAMITTNLSSVGYVYVNMDDCWAYARTPGTNVIIPEPTTFPDGIAPLAQLAHANGLKFGLYSDAGNFTCAGRPGSLGYETIDANTYAGWGVDYLKYDNCYDDNIPPETRYPVMRDALNATGRPIFYSMCEWGVDDPWTWCVCFLCIRNAYVRFHPPWILYVLKRDETQCSDPVQTFSNANNVCSGNVPQSSHFHRAGDVGNSWRTTGDISDNWDSMLSNWDNNGPAADAGPGGWNDPDMVFLCCLEVGNGGMTTTEYISHFSLWCIGKAPLIIGCDIRDMSADTKMILMNKEAIAISQDPLGQQCTMVASQNSGNQNVYGTPLSNDGYAIVFLNRWNNSAVNIPVTWTQLGLNSDTSYSIRDLWAHEDLGVYKGSFTAEQVSPHGVMMVRLTPTS